MKKNLEVMIKEERKSKITKTENSYDRINELKYENSSDSNTERQINQKIQD